MKKEVKLKHTKEEYRSQSRCQFWKGTGIVDDEGNESTEKAENELDKLVWEHIDQINELGFVVCIDYNIGNINTYVGKYNSRYGQGGGIFGELEDLATSFREYFSRLMEQIANGELDHMAKDEDSKDRYEMIEAVIAAEKEGKTEMKWDFSEELYNEFKHSKLKLIRNNENDFKNVTVIFNR